LNLLELLLFRNVHHSSVFMTVWDRTNLRVLLGRIFVSSVGLLRIHYTVSQK